MTKNSNDKISPEKESGKNAAKIKLTLGKHKGTLIKMGIVLICAAVVAFIMVIATNQTLFQEFISVL